MSDSLPTGARPRTILREIANDMANDARVFDGKPFNGRTVAEYFGNQGAAIAALARIVETMIPPDLQNGETHQGLRGTFTDADLKAAGQDWGSEVDHVES